MTKAINNSNNKRGVSRRTVVEGAVTLAGVTAAASFHANDAGAQTKLAQSVAKYQDNPKNGQECSTCVNFVAPAACRLVAGSISPHGWCQFYGKKTA